MSLELRHRALRAQRRAVKLGWRAYHRARALLGRRSLPDRPTAGRKEPRRGMYRNHPEWGLEPDDVSAIFVRAERGELGAQVALFNGLLERDAHARNLFEQRIAAVAGKPYVIQAGGEQTPQDQANADALAAAIRDTNFLELLEHQLTFNKYGYAGSEIEWSVRDAIVPTWFTNVRAECFRAAQPWGDVAGADDDELLLVTEANPMGERLAPGQWAVTRRDDSVLLARSALMRTCAWNCMFKLYGFRDFTIYVSRFGIPFVLAKIDEWENQQAKAVARALLASYGTDGGALVSGDVEIEAQDSRRSDGRASVHLDLIRLCNAENSKAINGVTLANDNGHQGGASYALGTTHAGIRWENIVRDAVRVQAMFERDIARPFMRFNSLSGAAPVLHIQVVQALDPRQLVEIADYFVNKLGIPISVRQMRQMIGLKAPSGDEDTAGGAKGRDLARVKGAA